MRYYIYSTISVPQLQYYSFTIGNIQISEEWLKKLVNKM